MKLNRIQTSPLLIFAVATLLAACSGYSQDVKPGGQPEPSNRELVWSAASKTGAYSVSIRPVEATIPIGQMHRWIVNLRSSDGVPVYPARIHVGGGMKGHGHGLPTQPQVLRYGGDGDYLVEGVRFSMHGEWLLRFVIEASEGNDMVDFNILVDY